MNFYDKNGNATAYTEDNIHIYLFNGKAVVYFQCNKVYGFNGSHLGWFENGWIRDLKGKCVMFSSKASGGPIKPIKNKAPRKNIKEDMPIKKNRKQVKIKNIYHLAWSHLSGIDFLLQGV